jgi:hypothetical protein
MKEEYERPESQRLKKRDFKKEAKVGRVAPTHKHTQILHGKNAFDVLLGQILFPTSIICYFSFHVGTFKLTCN